jgi:hypothetical protein
VGKSLRLDELRDIDNIDVGRMERAEEKMV